LHENDFLFKKFAKNVLLHLTMPPLLRLITNPIRRLL